MPSLIGTAPNQVPVNAMLGRMAFQDPESVVIVPVAGANPTQPGELVFRASSNTSLLMRYMGTDGVIRNATIVLS